jgi:hypothetical protein
MSRINHLANRNARAGSPRGGVATKLGIETLEPRCMLSVNVTTWHNDLTRQGDNTAETVLTPANVNSGTFGKLFSYSVTGQAYAEPLYVSNLNMGALGTHNVVFVATENNDVYAFDAVNNGAGGGQLWHVNLGLAATTPNAYFGNRYNNGQYTDITPQVGITSTPVIDLATNTIYIDSFRDDGSGNYSHHLYALDITTGATKNTVIVAAQVQGTNGADSSNGTITFVAKQELQRAAVTLLNGVVYFAYAGYADTDPFHGWILGYDASNLNLVKVFNDTPNNSVSEDVHEGEAGIWMSGSGLASDGTHLYLITGNGDFDSSVGDYGDTIMELTPDNSTQPTNKNGYGLSIVNNTTDTFTPYNEQTLADNDTDLGSGGAMLLPDQAGAHPHEILGAGKGGIIYLLDRDNFGGKHASDNSQVLGTATMAHATSNPAYFNNTVYYHAFGDLLKAFSITNGAISPAAVASGAFNYAFPGATPAVSSYGSSANGIVWETQYSTSDAILRAYNAVPNGSSLTTLYSSASGAIGTGVKFTVPTVADGRVYVGSSGKLTVFGLLSNPTTAPTAPTGLTATASSVQGLQVQLSWSDTSNNENAFLIERSTDGVNFAQIDVVSVGAISYTDKAVIAGTTYYYRVRATNPVGNSSYTAVAHATTVSASPVDVYSFDEGAGTIAGDSVGTNTGVLVGATKPQWVPGQIGSGALSFSGTGAYNQTNQSAVQVSSNLVASLGTTSTLAVWVKTTQTGSNTHSQAPAITGVDQAGTTSDINWGTLNASGQIGIYVGDSGGVYSTTPVNDGQWHHVAITRDAFTGQVQLYIDGVLNGSAALDVGTKAAQFYLIGALTDRNNAGYVTGANYFNGQLDEVRIYNRVLTATEISALGQPPSAPMGLSASTVPDVGTMLQLSWTNTSDTAQNVAVERKIGAGGTYEPIATLDSSQSSYIDTGLDQGTQYYYRVQASDSAGSSDYSNVASAVAPYTDILGRYIFYDNSRWDNEKATSNVTDGLALAPDKQALIPGETATFQNYTSFSQGITGIMIDVTNFDGSITRDDYDLRVGNSSDVNSWQPAPEPSQITMYRGFGVDGSIRLELIWDSNVIQNEWLQVTLKANENTGLVDDDVFYFGNAIGETGNSPTNTIVDATDELNVQNNHTSAATLTNIYDINRDKVVDAADDLIVHNNYSGSSPLILFTAPGGIHGAGSGLENDSIASATESTAGLGVQSVPLEPTLTQSVVTFASSKLSAAPIAFPQAHDRSSSVDAVFDALEGRPSKGTSAASLLNLESSRHAVAPTFADGDDTDYSHSWHASHNSDDVWATDELIADEFAPVQSDASLKSWLGRR